MPLIHREMIDLERDVIPVLRELGYKVSNDSEGRYVVVEAKSGVWRTTRIEIWNGSELMVRGDEAVAQLLVDRCRPFGRELTVNVCA